MKSIKGRLLGNFLFIIIVTVLIIEGFFIFAVRNYFYRSVEEILVNKINMSTELYEKYFSYTDLKDNIQDNVDFFYRDETIQVQIFDKSGTLLMDSIGVDSIKDWQVAGVKRALSGENSTYIGRVDYDNAEIMAVYAPLKNSEKTEGVICFITSLRQVNNKIFKISLMIIFIGFFVLIISGMISIKIADSIVKPIKELTSAAEKMANGDLKVRSIKRHNDEIGKLAETFNYMSEEILKRDKFKDEFISSVSHELRTPLTSIKGWAVTLKTGDLEDKDILNTGLDIIEKESDRLTSMVEELLNLSSYILGKNKLSKIRFQLLSFIKNLKIQLEPRINEAGINFSLNTLDDSVYLFADLDKIKQVFINIIDNAMRFTKNGGNIELNYYIENDFVYMTIKDDGIGIPENELSYVKEKFFKGKSNKSKNGIGLAICDEIIRQHGGILDIKSKVNEGTEVIIKLPYLEDSYEE